MTKQRSMLLASRLYIQQDMPGHFRKCHVHLSWIYEEGITIDIQIDGVKDMAVSRSLLHQCHCPALFNGSLNFCLTDWLCEWWHVYIRWSGHPYSKNSIIILLLTWIKKTRCDFTSGTELTAIHICNLRGIVHWHSCIMCKPIVYTRFINASVISNILNIPT